MRNGSKLLPPLWVLTMLTSAFVFWLVWQLKELVFLLVIGFSISYVIEPILQYLELKGVRRKVGLLILVTALIGLFAIMIATALPVLRMDYQKLVNNLPDYLQLTEERLKSMLAGVSGYLPVEKYLESPIEALRAWSGNLSEKILNAIKVFLLQGYSIGLALLNLALLPVIIYYISVDFPGIKKGFLSFFPISRRSLVAEILAEINTYVSNFVRGQIVICFILFVLYMLGLYLIGVDLWLLLALISGFGHIVPYLGFVVGIVLSSIMALVTYGDWASLLLVWIVYASVQLLEGSVISPKILGKKVGLNALTVILGLLAGGILFGLLGIFLAVPALAILKVLSRYVHKWLIENFEQTSEE